MFECQSHSGPRQAKSTRMGLALECSLREQQDRDPIAHGVRQDRGLVPPLDEQPAPEKPDQR